MALDVRDVVERYRTPDGRSLAVRIRLNSGPLVAGSSEHKFVYDIWSDTVNTASRTESQGIAGRIQVSRATYALVRDDFVCEERGAIETPTSKTAMATIIGRGLRPLRDRSVDPLRS